MRRLWWAWLLGTVLAAGALARPAFAQERRCQELGASCVCGETFDTPDFDVSTSGNDNGQARPLYHGAPGPKTCWSGGSQFPWRPVGSRPYTGAGKVLVPARATGFPVGSTVGYVWQQFHPGENNFGSDVKNLPSGSKRVCFRQYVRFSTDWGDCSQGVGKFFDMSWASPAPSGLKFQLAAVHKMFSPVLNSFGAYNAKLEATSNPGSFTTKECYGAWCLAEMCVSAGNGFGNDGAVNVDAYVQPVGNPSRRASFAQTLPGTFALGPNFGFALNPDGHRGPEYCPNGEWAAIPTTAHRDTSYTLEVAWSTDTGQTIGPAYEIEGGGGVTPETAQIGRPGKPVYAP